MRLVGLALVSIVGWLLAPANSDAEVLLSLPVGGAVYGSNVPAHLWLRGRIGFTTEVEDLRISHSASREGAFLTSLEAVIDLPPDPMFIRRFSEPETGMTAAMMLIWSQDTTKCGDVLGALGMEDGLDRLLSPRDVSAIEADARARDREIEGLPLALQLHHAMAKLPYSVALGGGGTLKPARASWGDGTFPIVALRTDKGEIVAIYVQFIPRKLGENASITAPHNDPFRLIRHISRRGQDWLVPTPCPGTPSDWHWPAQGGQL